jgi:hypothetical protein
MVDRFSQAEPIFFPDIPGKTGNAAGPKLPARAPLF